MKIFAFSLLVAFFFACAKDGKNIYVEGRVINPVTGEGMPNKKMELWKLTATVSGSGIDGKIVKEVLTDDQGNFVLDHNGSLFNSYLVRLTYELDNTNGIGYHRVGWKDVSGNILEGHNLDVVKGQYMNVSYELVPYGNIKYNFNNVNCFDSSDELRVYRTNEYDSYLPGAWIHYGCINYQGSFGGLKPMGTYHIQWEVIRYGSSQIFSDTFFLNEGELKTYTINY